MSNWFKKAQLGVDVDTGFRESEMVMYSAVVPIDIKITSTGNPETDQETAYSMIKEILANGSGSNSGTATHEGFRENLQLTAVHRSSQ